MKKRRRGPNDPVTAEKLEWLGKEYNMDHTFRKLSELTGVHRDPVTLAEILPETGGLQTGIHPETGGLPERIPPETGVITPPDPTSSVNLVALRNNPLIAWRQVPLDLLDRLRQIIVGEPCHVNWEAVQNAFRTERVTANNRLALLEIFEEADRAKSFSSFLTLNPLEKPLPSESPLLIESATALKSPASS